MKQLPSSWAVTVPVIAALGECFVISGSGMLVRHGCCGSHHLNLGSLFGVSTFLRSEYGFSESGSIFFRREIAMARAIRGSAVVRDGGFLMPTALARPFYCFLRLLPCLKGTQILFA